MFDRFCSPHRTDNGASDALVGRSDFTREPFPMSLPEFSQNSGKVGEFAVTSGKTSGPPELAKLS